MDNPLINNLRLDLLRESLTLRESKKLEKRLKKLTKGFSKDSIRLLDLLSRIDSKVTDLPPYSIGAREVVILRRSDRLGDFVDDVYSSKVIGFDTEQRPTFKKGEKQKPLSIMQIATRDRVYIIQLHKLRSTKDIERIINDSSIIKVGFGLGNDSKELRKLLGSEPNSLFDISLFIKDRLKLKTSVGAKRAISIFLEQKLQKSKKTVLSNWEKERLDSSQIKYASEDATAPLDVYYNIRDNYPLIGKKLPMV